MDNAAAAMVAGGNRLSPTESADETGTAEQGTAINSKQYLAANNYARIQHSAFRIQHSAFSIQHYYFCIIICQCIKK